MFWTSDVINGYNNTTVSKDSGFAIIIEVSAGRDIQYITSNGNSILTLFNNATVVGKVKGIGQYSSTVNWQVSGYIGIAISSWLNWQAG